MKKRNYEEEWDDLVEEIWEAKFLREMHFPPQAQKWKLLSNRNKNESKN